MSALLRPTVLDPTLGELTLDRLTRDVWLWQRKKGHRFSADDLVTTWVAVTAAPEARTVLDLGCGIGSVLLHLAWSLPEARCTGIEAQAISHALLLRNIAHNGLSDRVVVYHGDLRELHTDVRERDFDLVTGTPPYFPVDHALDAEDEQRAYARIEYRGGVEAYLEAGRHLLGPDGRLVLCGAAHAEERVATAARLNDLHLNAKTSVVARAPNPPLFAVWTLSRAPAPFASHTLTLRDEAGRRTAEAAALRAFSGIPEGAGAEQAAANAQEVSRNRRERSGCKEREDPETGAYLGVCEDFGEDPRRRRRGAQ